jgi:hypothetical protein
MPAPHHETEKELPDKPYFLTEAAPTPVFPGFPFLGAVVCVTGFVAAVVTFTGGCVDTGRVARAVPVAGFAGGFAAVGAASAGEGDGAFAGAAFVAADLEGWDAGPGAAAVVAPVGPRSNSAKTACAASSLLGTAGPYFSDSC